MLWDGTELLELGGTRGGRTGGSPADGTAAYNPTTGRWRRLAPVPATVDPAESASVWTGRLVFMFAGPPLRHERSHSVAGLYDPARNAWTVTSAAPTGPLSQSTAVWTGARVILAGMASGPGRLRLASYDPATNVWTELHPPFPARHPTDDFAMVETGDGILLWSFWGRSRQIGPHEYEGFSGIDLDRLTESDRWIRIPRWPLHSGFGTASFAGSSVLLPAGQDWCGTCLGPPSFDTHGYLLDPRTLNLRPVPHGPLDDISPQVVWTGTREIELDAGGLIGGKEDVRPGDTAIWNPTTRRWRRGPRAPRQLGDQPAVWSGNQLLVLSLSGRLLALHQ